MLICRTTLQLHEQGCSTDLWPPPSCPCERFQFSIPDISLDCPERFLVLHGSLKARAYWGTVNELGYA
jgi:hypothetical protein